MLRVGVPRGDDDGAEDQRHQQRGADADDPGAHVDHGATSVAAAALRTLMTGVVDEQQRADD